MSKEKLRKFISAGLDNDSLKPKITAFIKRSEDEKDRSFLQTPSKADSKCSMPEAKLTQTKIKIKASNYRIPLKKKQPEEPVIQDQIL